jgi:hypothetical protein
VEHCLFQKQMAELHCVSYMNPHNELLQLPLAMGILFVSSVSAVVRYFTLPVTEEQRTFAWLKCGRKLLVFSFDVGSLVHFLGR